MSVQPIEHAFPDFGSAPALTVNDIIDFYLKDRRNEFADRRCKHPESLACHFVAVRKAWGDMLIADFQRGSKARCKDQVERWRREDNNSVGTCRKRISQLKTAFKFCIEEEIIPVAYNPVLKLPPQGAPRERVLDLKEIAALLYEADRPDTPAHIRLCLHLSLRTGQRQSAIRDLRWIHVDFENRVIRFRDTEAPDERSKKRRSDMPMDAALFALLTAAKENADSEFVLEWRGRQVGSTYAGLKALYTRAGIEGVHRHDLRRSAATLAYRASGDMNSVANYLGDTAAVTARHYAHATAADRLGPVQAISDALEQARKKT